jgi:hypothetical protein
MRIVRKINAIFLSAAVVVGVAFAIVFRSVWAGMFCVACVSASLILARWFLRKTGWDLELERTEARAAERAERPGENRQSDAEPHPLEPPRS